MLRRLLARLRKTHENGPENAPVVGGIYTIADSPGQPFGVVKVLCWESGVVHLSLYRNRFQTRPERINPVSLELGRMGDAEGFGIGHLPISSRLFNAWRPQLVARSEVPAEELEGVRLWKEARGGVWD
ncbi:MAG: hypothetical protein H6811_08875 [Phycisphaeraceae bacterium]|nr:hypothetical protein [Phycisphaeraceae bacterium]